MKKDTESRVNAEKDRLSAVFAKYAPDKAELAGYFIDRAAWIKIQCEDMEQDIQKNGWTMLVQQAKSQAPHEKTRPIAVQYHKMAESYLRTMRTLSNMLPKDAGVLDDGFDELMRRYSD